MRYPWTRGVAKRLTTDTGKGLEAAEAAKRLQEYGPNRLPEGKKRGPLMGCDRRTQRR